MHNGNLRRSVGGASLALALGATAVGAASHREAPLMTLDPAADLTDVYAFVSYDAANAARSLGDRRVTLIMNVLPGQEPGSGPNYYAFDDNVLYVLHVDNDRDGIAEDVNYEFRFKTEVRNPGQFIATLAPIDSLEADGLSRVQRYTVTETRCHRQEEDGEIEVECDRHPLFGGAAKPTVPEAAARPRLRVAGP